MFDILFDIGSAIWDVVEIVKNPTSGWAWGSLGADVACAFVPFVAGGGVAVRGAKAVNAIDNAADAAKAANRGTDAIQGISKLDDAARAGKGTRAIVIGEDMNRVNRAANKLRAEGLAVDVFTGEGKLANEAWIKRAMNEGAKIYDIGPSYARRAERLRAGKSAPGYYYSLERRWSKGYNNVERLWDRRGRVMYSALVDKVPW